MKPRYLYFRGNSNFPYKFYKKVLFLLLVLLVSTNTLISQPIIRVSGNGVIIENGDQTPNTNDQTDFGAVYSSSGSVYRFFKIENTGNSPLILSDSKLRIEGENPGDFELLNLDYVSPIINPGSYLTVRIDFDPKGNGIRKATAVIENNDPDDNPFIFTIQGNGLEPFQDPNGIFTDINAEIQGVGSDGSYIGRSSSDWGDYDNDGDLDFVITGFSFRGFKTKIYKNEGNNIFTDINADIVQTGRSCVKWGDYDNDNDLDLIVTGLGSGMNGQRTIIYRNDGYDIFIQAAAIIGLEHSSASWGDYDNDGDLDILVAGHSSSGSITNIYKNVGNDSFTAISANIAAVNWGGAEWGDFDNDSDLDLAIIGQNSYGYNDPILKVYRNNGNGNFTDINTNLTDLAYSFITWGDYDSDGDLDLAVTGDNNSISYSIIYRNDGGNIFTNINAGLPGVKDGAIKFGDYDNDGDLDLVLTGTTNQSSLTTITSVFENKGADIFNKKTELISLRNSSVSWGDYDSDGDLDLISTGDVENYQVTKIYNNSSATANTKPNPPINLQTEVNGSSVLLKWDKSSDNESPQNSLTYNIYIGSAAGAVDVVSPMSKISDGTRRIAQIGNTNQNTEWEINNLEAGKNYYWSVQAIDNNFEGSVFSPEHSFHADISQYQPSGLTADSGNHLVVLQWPREPEINILKYYIYSSTSQFTPVKIDSTAGNSDTLFVVRNLENNLRYYFWITAVDSEYNESMLSIPASTVPTKIPTLVFPVDFLDFINTAVGDTAEFILFAKNNTPDSVVINQFYNANSVFKVNANPGSLSPNDSLSIAFLFMPNNFGIYSDTLKILTEEDTLYLLINGNSPSPTLSINLDQINFIYAPKDSTRSIALNITNNSVNKLIIDSIFTYTSEFFTSSSDTVVLSESSINLKIYFSPDSLGEFKDTLTLHNNSPIPVIKIPLTGNSKLAKLALLSVSINFDSVALNTEKIESLKIHNLSDNILEISAVSIGSNLFNVLTSLPSFISGNDSLELQLKFGAAFPGVFQDTALIFTNGGDSIIILSAVCPFPKIYISTDTLNFGNVKIDSIGVKHFSLSNSSISTLTIDSIKTATSYFGQSELTLPIYILFNQSFELSVEFKPDSAGDFLDSLCIFNNSEQTPLSIFLVGNGQPLTGVVGNSNNIPYEYGLSQNYPNPFNPSTTIKYQIPRYSFVSLKVFDAIGREVANLVNGQQNAGDYEIHFNANYLSSGIYFYRIQAGEFSETKKLILLK